MLIEAQILASVFLAFLGIAVVAAAYNWTRDRSVEKLKARWASSPSRFIEMDGMQVHIRDEGPVDDPTPIVLIHGTGSSLHTWQGWADQLKATHRVISLDRPGFGLTGPNPTGNYTMAYYADFMRRFLDRMNVRRAILVGNSSGGRVAWRLAAASPDRVARLVLISPGGYPRTTPLPLGLRLSMSPVFGPILLHILPRSAVEKSLRAAYGDPSKVTPELVDRNIEVTSREGNRAALGATLRQALESDDSSLLRKITAPTLILWGTRDTVIPPSDTERFHDDIPGSVVKLLPGVGHLAQEEDPAGTVAALNQFLADTAPERSGGGD